MPILKSLFIFCLLLSLLNCPLRAAEPTGPLTLRRAVALVLLQHPELEIYAKDIRIADARKLQVGLKPNPALGLLAEDLGGTGEYETLQRAQHTLELSQLFELGGKRAARVRAAAAGKALVEWDYQAKRLEVAGQTMNAFVDLLGVQRRLALSMETLAMTERFAPLTQRRVDAGSASPVEMTRARVTTASAKIAVEQQKGQLAVARKRLAALWGSTDPQFSTAIGDLDRVRNLPSLASATRRLVGNPRLARHEAEIMDRAAQLAAEKAKAHPDLTVSGGVRHYNESSDAALVMGISLPLPFFNRNQGGITEAGVQLEKVETQHESARVQLSTSLAIAYEEMENAKIQITAYRESVLPQIEEADKLTAEGYENGRSSHLEILESRRALSDARLQYLEALISYHKAVAAIESLMGEALPNVADNNPSSK